MKPHYDYLCVNGKTIRTHRVVWQNHYGQIPKGHEIHHINGDGEDNRIENLILLTPEEHRRIHNGFFKIEGTWFKQCPHCKEVKPIIKGIWQFNGKYPKTLCFPCHREYTYEYFKQHPEVKLKSRINNREKRILYNREYRIRNREKVKEYHREYRKRKKLSIPTN